MSVFKSYRNSTCMLFSTEFFTVIQYRTEKESGLFRVNTVHVDSTDMCDFERENTSCLQTCLPCRI